MFKPHRVTLTFDSIWILDENEVKEIEKVNDYSRKTQYKSIYHYLNSFEKGQDLKDLLREEEAEIEIRVINSYSELEDQGLDEKFDLSLPCYGSRNFGEDVSLGEFFEEVKVVKYPNETQENGIVRIGNKKYSLKEIE